MAHKFRGEVEIESGLGLPELTTAERVAYTPPADGYVVFDTDLKRICIWDSTAIEWIISATSVEVAEKIDILNGIGTDTLTLNDNNAGTVIKFDSDVTGFPAQQFYTGEVVTSTISTNATSMELEFEGGSFLRLQSDHTLTNQPIRGVDGTDPSSLVTKGYFDGFTINGEYEAAFVSGDWIAGTPNTLVVTQATHGISHTVGESFTVVVHELIGGVYQKVSIKSAVNTTTGDVTLKTVGAAFDGRVFIS
jgi:hypothetical protein